jgi:hypothetical protein
VTDPAAWPQSVVKVLGVRRVTASIAIVLVVLLVCGCDPQTFADGLARSEPDGVQIDGVWVGEPARCPADGALSCARLTRCATSQIWPNGAPAIAQVRFFQLPARLKDGTIISRGAGGTVVVFDLDDGPSRATHVFSTDSC